MKQEIIIVAMLAGLLLAGGCSPSQQQSALETLQMKQAIDQNSIAIQQIWANKDLTQAEKVKLTSEIVIGLGEKAEIITAEEAANWQSFKDLLADNAVMIGSLALGQANPLSITTLIAIGLMLLKNRKKP
jgi:hypothetical protein